MKNFFFPSCECSSVWAYQDKRHRSLMLDPRWTLDEPSLGQVEPSSSVDVKHAEGRWLRFPPLADWQVFAPILILGIANTASCFRPLATIIIVCRYIVSPRSLARTSNSDQGRLLILPCLSISNPLHPLGNYFQTEKAVSTQILSSQLITHRRYPSNLSS